MIKNAVAWVSGLVLLASAPLLAEGPEGTAGRDSSLKSLAEIKQAIQKTQDELDQLRQKEATRPPITEAEPVTAVVEKAAASEVKQKDTHATAPVLAEKRTAPRQVERARVSRSKPAVLAEIRKVQPRVDRLAMRNGKRRSAGSSRLKAVIDLDDQRMRVYVNGDHEYTWKVSTGRSGHLTPTGTYKPQWLARMHYSSKYDDAPMPYSVFFHGGYAVHGTNSISRLGRPASHGCVRLHPNNAKTLFNLVKEHGKGNATIEIVGEPPIRYRRYKNAQSVRPVYEEERDSSRNERSSARSGSGWKPFEFH
jgi:lipoprotein-anchoring transpeptidase ErfK/SrfK